MNICGIINLEVNNIKSIYSACSKYSKSYIINSKKDYKPKTSSLVLPGNGSFEECMNSLKKKELIEVIKYHIIKKKIFLGICSGLQLLFESSEESPGIEGMKILKGKVVKIPNKKYKIPLLGWYDVNSMSNKKKKVFFFNNSYMISPDEKKIVKLKINNEIPAMINKNKIFGCQFHLEKSADSGLILLKKIINK
jgi:glutamine amidotransferase